MGAILGSGSGGGRFLKQLTVVILGMAGMGLAALLLIMPRYRVQQQALSMAKEAVIKSNMRKLHLSLSQYLAEDGRGYPASLETGSAAEPGPMSDFLGSTIRRMRNPLDPKVPAVAMSWKDPPFWPVFKPGQLVYVPLGIREGVAAGYVIYGVGTNGPISAVIDCRPESWREDGPGMELETGR